MKRRSAKALIALAASVVMLAGCGNTTAPEEPAQTTETETADATAEDNKEETAAVTAEETDTLSDEEKAKEVADLIDAIYVQQWT